MDENKKMIPSNLLAGLFTRRTTIKSAGFFARCVLLSVMAVSPPGCGYLSEQAKYEPMWESLKQYEVPEWFKDAKFGIYTHWGVYAVPAAGSEWYPRHMYEQGHWLYEHHKRTWGDQLEFGYKDFIPMFKAEHFDADRWAELFRRAGARFAGPVAIHHDGFAMWDSDFTEWDAAEKGPKRDITGELVKAIRKRGMKVVTSFHHAYNWRYYEPSYKGNYDTSDPQYAGLYSQPHPPGAPESEEFLINWQAKVEEVIDKYSPDQLWFDFGWGRSTFEPYKRDLIAYYYNKAKEWGKQVVVTHKRNLPEGVGVLDIERGREDKLAPYLWQTDDSVARNTWCYTTNMDLKPVKELIGELVDIVSKNGILLLNIGPRSDGTIPDEQKQLLLGIGKWLEINGEAIYGTRPWHTFAEAKTVIETGYPDEKQKKSFTTNDIRFTSKDNVLYAICMDWSGKKLSIKSLGINAMPGIKIADVTMLGSDEKLKYQQKKKELTIETTNKKTLENAFVFRITLKGCSFAGFDVTQDKDAEITAAIVVQNFNNTTWDGSLKLYVDGKDVAARNVKIKPHEKKTLTFKHCLAQAGVYKVAIAADPFSVEALRRTNGNLGPEKTVLIPNISLIGKWRFHKGDESHWNDTNLDDSKWETVELPASWENHSNVNLNPAFGWYRKTITIPRQWKGHRLVLPLGKIDDVDETYFNGKRIGSMGHFPPNYETAWNKVRRYPVPPELIEYGRKNVIAIRVYDGGGSGGLYAGPLGPVEFADRP